MITYKILISKSRDYALHFITKDKECITVWKQQINNPSLEQLGIETFKWAKEFVACVEKE